MQTDPRFSLVFAKKKKEFAVPAPLAPIADTHAHLMSFWDKDPAEAIARAALAGVRQMTTIWDPLADHRDAWLAGSIRRKTCLTRPLPPVWLRQSSLAS